jgi:hypothetical protein
MMAKDKMKRAPKGTEDLETFFLSVVEKEIMDRIFDNTNGYKPNPKSEDILVVSKNLKLTSIVVIPMDKTNSCKCIHIDYYKNWELGHQAPPE